MFLAAKGGGGDIRVNAYDFVDISGFSSAGFSSGMFTNTQREASGQGGNIIVNTGAFRIAEGAVVTAQTLNPSDGGDAIINANIFEAVDGGQILTGAFSDGKAGNITLNVTDSVTISGSDPTFADRFEQFGRDIVANSGPASGLFANTESNSTGNGGDIILNTTNLNLSGGAEISAQSQGSGIAGNIIIQADGLFSATDSDITTAARRASGGAINLAASDIHLSGDSDIRTNVSSGTGGGGNITLIADLIVVFDDSDILAFASDGQGGDITLNTPAFFGENFNPALSDVPPEALETLDGNDRVDINSSGQLSSGTITLPDISFIENNLNELSGNLVNTETLTAGSCIVRSSDTEGSFIITGGEGLPQQPGGDTLSIYPTGTIQTIPETTATQTIQEPEGVFQLADGRLVLSHECN